MKSFKSKKVNTTWIWLGTNDTNFSLLKAMEIFLVTESDYVLPDPCSSGIEKLYRYRLSIAL